MFKIIFKNNLLAVPQDAGVLCLGAVTHLTVSGEGGGGGGVRRGGVGQKEVSKAVNSFPTSIIVTYSFTKM